MDGMLDARSPMDTHQKMARKLEFLQVNSINQPSVSNFCSLYKQVRMSCKETQRLSNQLDRFSSPSNYLDYQIYSTARAKNILSLPEISKGNNEVNITSAAHDSYMRKCNTNTHFIEADTIDSLVLTEIPNPHMIDRSAYSHYDFSIPLGTLQDGEGVDIYRIVVVDYREMKRLNGEAFDVSSQPLYIIYAYTLDTSVQAIPVGSGRGEVAPGAYANDQIFSNAQIIENVALNAMMMIINMPTTVREGVGGKQKGFGKSTKRSPLMLGLGTESVRYTNTGTGSVTSNLRGKMPPHIRRGHWRRYRTGQGRTNTKWNWILPTKINC